MMVNARLTRGKAVSEGRKRYADSMKQSDMFIPVELQIRMERRELFPSQPWNVRAAIEAMGPRIFPDWPNVPAETVVYEPCAGLGHMVAVLQEYFPDVRGTDIEDWGKGFPLADALAFEADGAPYDSIAVTNPPFSGEEGDMAEKIVRQLQKTCDNVIILARLGFICGQRRFALHHENPLGNLKTFMPCTERTAMVLGTYDPKANKPQEFAWFHFQRGFTGHYTGANLPVGSRAKHFRPEDVRI